MSLLVVCFPKLHLRKLVEEAAGQAWQHTLARLSPCCARRVGAKCPRAPRWPSEHGNAKVIALPHRCIRLGNRFKPSIRFGLIGFTRIRFLETEDRSVPQRTINRRVWRRFLRVRFSVSSNKPINSGRRSRAEISAGRTTAGRSHPMRRRPRRAAAADAPPPTAHERSRGATPPTAPLSMRRRSQSRSSPAADAAPPLLDAPATCEAAALLHQRPTTCCTCRGRARTAAPAGAEVAEVSSTKLGSPKG
jgi:hypothetical protein